mmetsp:Transcript_32381/g.96451  ORF Transcript_32381/g.96451 Transcript_32381/m.96451 type:complete len:157 (-) Transcript_32381:363-833(-)
MNRIRAFFLKHILPEVHKYFFDALDCIRDDLYSMGLLYTFVDLFTSTSMGDLFVPRNHDDDDTWLSVLVAVGECSLGGGFAHPAQGVVHAVNPGDIFVVNPTQGHCTSIFGDPLATRKMIAVYLSDNALKASAVSVEVAKREGLTQWVPQLRKRKR